MEWHGEPRGDGLRILIVASRYHEPLTGLLVEGARRRCTEAGTAPEAIDVAWVPGAWEIPLALGRLLPAGRYDAAVALGCVIRGETEHHRHLAEEAARGVAAIARETGVPVAFGIVTAETAEQAHARCHDPDDNRGREAAEATLRTADLFRRAAAGGTS